VSALVMWVLDELPLETDALMLAFTAFQTPNIAVHQTTPLHSYLHDTRTGSAETPHWMATEKYEAANNLNLRVCLETTGLRCNALQSYQVNKYELTVKNSASLVNSALFK